MAKWGVISVAGSMEQAQRVKDYHQRKSPRDTFRIKRSGREYAIERMMTSRTNTQAHWSGHYQR